MKLTDDMSLHIFELPKIKRLSEEDEPMDDMLEWLHFFSHAHKEVNMTMRKHYKNSAIHSAFGLLEEMSADEKTRYLAEIREKSLKNRNSELGAARRQGRREGERIGRREGERIGRKDGERVGRREEKESVAMNMIDIGSFSMEQISQVTGLSMDEVLSLQNTRQVEAA